MSQEQYHLRADHYALVGEEKLSRAGFVVRLHQHLVQVCADCRAGWEQLADHQQAVRELLAEGVRHPSDPPPPVAPEHLPAFSEEALQLEAEVRRVRAVRSQACRDGWELLRQDPEERQRRLEVAYRRYRSRSEAEYVLEKAKQVIRDDPRESGLRAALALRILERMGPEGDQPWAAALATRAAAWQGNALRVAGDLPAADRVFAALRREMVGAPLEDSRAVAEVASLEASLRIDQRRIPEAHGLLDLASLVFRWEGDEVGEVKTLIQQAILFSTEREVERSLACLEQATEQLDRLEGESYLRFCVVNRQVLNLCELERWEEAERFLDEHQGVYEDMEQIHAGALLRHVRGRIARGRERLDEAGRMLEDAVEAFLAADRSYDAVTAALDLAEVFAADGRHRDLARLAAQLVQLFRTLKVPRPTLAALQLLGRAARAEAATTQMVEGLRSRYEADAEA